MPAPAELSVPAKAFVAGEYAVLERGEPALVLAVDLRLRAALRELPGRAVELLRRPGGESVRGELIGGGVRWQSGIPGELRFAAGAVRARDDNLLVIRSEYEQPFGTFSGTLPGGIELAEGYGVMERHVAVW